MLLLRYLSLVFLHLWSTSHQCFFQTGCVEEGRWPPPPVQEHTGVWSFLYRSFKKLIEQHSSTRVSFSVDENYLKQGIRQWQHQRSVLGDGWRRGETLQTDVGCFTKRNTSKDVLKYIFVTLQQCYVSSLAAPRVRLFCMTWAIIYVSCEWVKLQIIASPPCVPISGIIREWTLCPPPLWGYCLLICGSPLEKTQKMLKEIKCKKKIIIKGKRREG